MDGFLYVKERERDGRWIGYVLHIKIEERRSANMHQKRFTQKISFFLFEVEKLIFFGLHKQKWSRILFLLLLIFLTIDRSVFYYFQNQTIVSLFKRHYTVQNIHLKHFVKCDDSHGHHWTFRKSRF
jgi:hypothetical protein